MSLLERAQAMKAQEEETFDRIRSVDDLRQALLRHISLETIAVILAENPERARNEMRSAARQVFSEPDWIEIPADQKEQLLTELIDVVFGMGPIDALLDDEEVTEIMVNGPRSIFYERDGKLIAGDVAFENDNQVRILIDRIIGPLGRRIDESSPMVNARLPQGHRVHAVIPPISPDGSVVTIRKFSQAIITLDEMCVSGSIGKFVDQFLIWAVQARKNLAVSGGTGSGKTTLLNALSCHIPFGERIITIEDSAELKFTEHPHVVRLEARPRNAEGSGEVTIRDLVINSLRMRPDRIIVGECRGGEALDMLQAMNTGHEGSLTTLHANSPFEAIDRLITMVRYAVDLPIDAIEAQIGNAFDLIIQVARSREGNRFLTEITEVSFDRTNRTCELNRIYERSSFESLGSWLCHPRLLCELQDRGVATEQEVDSWWSSLS